MTGENENTVWMEGREEVLPAPEYTRVKQTRGGRKMMREETKYRGVFEKEPGSGKWWIRYVDSEGRYRRELAGPKGVAISLYQKRKVEALQRKKLPEKLRRRVVPFSELCDDALKYVKANNEGQQIDTYRINCLKKQFGEHPASIPIEQLRNWFNEQEWESGTFNRYRTVLSGIYRLGIENGKISCNPARLLKRKREPDGRVRFLNQFPPADTEVESLRPHKDEESRLRAIIAAEYPQHMEELDIALNTGMRRSEQYTRIDWSCVDLARRDLTIPKSKIGPGRHIPLNPAACAAFRRLLKRSIGEGPVFLGKGGERLLGPRHWFEDVVEKAGLKVPLTWHDLRHTFASRLVMAGVDIRTVAELMGHRRIQMTMRYAHLAPAHKFDAVERLAVYNSSGSAPVPEPQAEAAVTEGPTDTTTDTGEKRAISVGPGAVN